MLCVGKGAVYSFDPVGSYQRDTYKAGGSASAMLQPLLDNQVYNMHIKVIVINWNWNKIKKLNVETGIKL